MRFILSHPHAAQPRRQLAEDEEHRYPLGTSADVYMDDILSGAATLREAQDIQR